MDCKTFEQNIKPFIHGELDISALKEFLIHLNQCDECREELEIRYLVEKTLVDINEDEHTSYNFEYLLKEYISENEEKIFNHSRNVFFQRTIYITAGIANLCCMVYFFSDMVIDNVLKFFLNIF